MSAGTADALLDSARWYADAMIAHGRDTYGSEHSPLFAAMLDRQTLRLPDAAALPDLMDYGVRQQDRVWSSANPQHDQPLYELLDLLSEVTGDRRYAAAGDDALRWFFTHCQSPVTGLFAWGEHIGWNLETEAVLDTAARGQIHEFFEAWGLWPKTYALAPEAAVRFARGLWRHQISDQGTVDYSRHARYDVHAPGSGASYPRHGGHYALAWAHAYAHAPGDETRDEMAGAAGALAASFKRRRAASSSGALPAGTDAVHANVYWMENDLLMAVEVSRAAALLPEPAAGALREQAAASDLVIAERIPHELDSDKKGFLRRLYADTLAPGDPRGKRTDIYSGLWDAGYGTASTASVALLMLDRYEQTRSERYRTLALDAAALYLASEPDPSAVHHPGTLAAAMSLMLRAAGLETPARASLLRQRAALFGDHAMRLFLDADSPLPKVTSQHEHYEALTGGPDLMLALAQVATSAR